MQLLLWGYSTSTTPIVGTHYTYNYYCGAILHVQLLLSIGIIFIFCQTLHQPYLGRIAFNFTKTRIVFYRATQGLSSDVNVMQIE